MNNRKQNLHALLLSVLSAVSAAGCTGSASRQSTGEFVDDSVATTRVKTAD